MKFQAGTFLFFFLFALGCEYQELGNRESRNQREEVEKPKQQNREVESEPESRAGGSSEEAVVETFRRNTRSLISDNDSGEFSLRTVALGHDCSDSNGGLDSETYSDMLYSYIYGAETFFDKLVIYHPEYEDELEEAVTSLLSAVTHWCMSNLEAGDAEMRKAVAILERIYKDLS